MFAFKDSLKFLEEKFEKSNKSLFLNDTTHNLFNKLKIWYEKKDILNFEDAFEETIKFFNCLGISFEDTHGGNLYVRVLDI